MESTGTEISSARLTQVPPLEPEIVGNRRGRRHPALVASRQLPGRGTESGSEGPLTMHRGPEGKKILAGLLIDRFLPLKEEWY